MKPIYHHYLKWEDYHLGMWRKVDKQEHDIFLKQAIEFTGNVELYGEWMLKVIDAMPISCEHNLSDTNYNRQAWIGHAACCLSFKCPEYIVREAWSYLSDEIQLQANRKADFAIMMWEIKYDEKQNSQLYFNMEESWISRRNT